MNRHSTPGTGSSPSSITVREKCLYHKAGDFFRPYSAYGVLVYDVSNRIIGFIMSSELPIEHCHGESLVHEGLESRLFVPLLCSSCKSKRRELARVSSKNKTAESACKGDHWHNDFTWVRTSCFVHNYSGGWPPLSLAINSRSKSRQREAGIGTKYDIYPTQDFTCLLLAATKESTVTCSTLPRFCNRSVRQ